MPANPGFTLNQVPTAAQWNGAFTTPGGSYQHVVGSPTAPNSTSVYRMQGLAGAVTPLGSGALRIAISGTIISSTATAGDGIIYQISYGTGTAPANAATLTGTQIGAIQAYTNPTTVTAADVALPFCLEAIVTGLTVGTAYWIDLAAKSLGTVSSGALSQVSVTVSEL